LDEICRQRGQLLAAGLFVEALGLVPEAVFVLNRTRQIIFVNAAGQELCGSRAVDDILGRRLGEVVGCRVALAAEGGCGTEDACRYCGAVTSQLGARPGHPVVEECRIPKARGDYDDALDLRAWSRSLDLAGERLLFVALRDIGDEKRRAFLERIFLHDVLNTATALQAVSEVLDEGLVPLPSRDEFIRRLGRLSGRMIDEIVAYREVVLAERGELQPAPRSIDALTLLQDVMGGFDASGLLSARRLVLAPAAQAAFFVVDPVLLSRVLVNMIKNALEAALPGETVTVGCRLEGQEVCFWVHNPGAMPRKVQLQVFRRSFSTKGEGRGLGTWSMKYLSERYLGGHVDFSSTEEAGTTFRACLPLQAPAQATSPQPAASC